ncbi:MAG: NADH-quinone oxidoreductase subunit NuoK [Prevotella sp.]|nr:NADH-quinone oxidoreductase subunit NuoK [Prevotella sp.]
MVPVEYYFVLSALLFFIGVFGFITRRNLIAMLISIELVLNAVDINFAAFNRLLYPTLNGGAGEGFFMTLFSIGVSAAESAVAIAIIINVYRNFKSDSVDSIKNMKW